MASVRFHFATELQESTWTGFASTPMRQRWGNRGQAGTTLCEGPHRAGRRVVVFPRNTGGSWTGAGAGAARTGRGHPRHHRRRPVEPHAPSCGGRGQARHEVPSRSGELGAVPGRGLRPGREHPDEPGDGSRESNSSTKVSTSASARAGSGRSKPQGRRGEGGRAE